MEKSLKKNFGTGGAQEKEPEVDRFGAQPDLKNLDKSVPASRTWKIPNFENEKAALDKFGKMDHVEKIKYEKTREHNAKLEG